ncbi:MAG: type IV toxin-antitoxin system AbiEi family antitoxin [Kiritimatiellales bacterium]
MSVQNSIKINRLLQHAVPKTVLTLPWLALQGVSKGLAQRYVSSGWLYRIGHGAYVRAGEAVEWDGALFSLQTQLEMNTHVAGLTALELKGLAHFLPLGQRSPVILFSDGFDRLPLWFSKKDWGVELIHRNIHLFDAAETFSKSTIQREGFVLTASTAERAVFELLYGINDNSSFEYAQTVFAGLSMLRPDELQQLLQACRSVKVKRIFLWMAETCSHPWVKYLDYNRVDIGKGKRVVYQGGVLDKNFLITVPPAKIYEGVPDV